jgi:beta-glucuronidase
MLDFRFDIKLNKPVVITEFGADALGGYHADADTRWSEEYQDAVPQPVQDADGIPGLRGMTPWVLVDFRSPRRTHPYFQDFWNRKGLISDDPQEEAGFWTVEALLRVP